MSLIEDIKIEEIKNQGLERILKITILAAYVEEKYQESIAKMLVNASIPGFRKGRVPRNVFEIKYGFATYEDLVADLVKQTANDAIKDLNLVQRPLLDNLEKHRNKDVVFTLQFEVFDDFVLPDLSKITIEKPVTQISQDIIDQEIQKILKQKTNYNDIEQAATLKSAIMIDVEGSTSDGDVFPQQKIEKALMHLDDDRFFSAKFNKALVGKKAGDECEVAVKYAKDYEDSRIAGKTVNYKVKVHSVHEIVVPQLDDELAKAVGYTNVDELKADILKKKEEEYAEQIQVITAMRLFDELEKLLTFVIPNSLLEEEITSIIKQIDNIKSEDESLKDKTDEEIRQYAEKFAARRIRIGMMLNDYAKSKNIRINSDDIRKEVIKKVKMFPQHMQKEMIDWYYKDQKHLNTLSGSALEHKVVNHIINNDVAIKEVSSTIEEILNLVESETQKRMY